VAIRLKATPNKGEKQLWEKNETLLEESKGIQSGYV